MGLRERRPHLAGPTRLLIEATRTAHESGWGKVPLKAFVELLGDLPEDHLRSVQDRGHMVLKRTGDGGGAFANSASAELQLTALRMMFVIPRDLGGSYSVDAHGCQYAFRRGFAIRAHRPPFSSGVERLILRPNSLRVELEMRTFNIEYLF